MLTRVRPRSLEKGIKLLGELSNLKVKVAAVQETRFICAVDYLVLEYDSFFFQHTAAATTLGVSLQIGRSLCADKSVVFVGDDDQLVVVDDAVKSFKFRVDTVYAPNTVCERTSFFDGWHSSSTIRNG